MIPAPPFVFSNDPDPFDRQFGPCVLIIKVSNISGSIPKQNKPLFLEQMQVKSDLMKG
jgi:hypothetical protein